MRLNRFFLKKEFKKGEFIISEKEIINQMKNVLRLKAGESVIFFNEQFGEAQFKIKGYEKNLIVGEITSISSGKKSPSINLKLYCSILKKENFELVCQKTTEIGVSQIIPVISKRTVKLSLKKDRLEKIVKEASEQSGRTTIPQISAPVSLSLAIKTGSDLNIAFDKSGGSIISLVQFKNLNDISIFIGPEGGWDEGELELFKKNGFKVISLGGLTLRAETAAILSSFSAMNIFGN